MKLNMSYDTKLVLIEKLLEFGMEMVAKDSIESFCPERLSIHNFDPSNSHLIKIAIIKPKLKSKDKLKFYQAPEVLVGQSETESSLVWTLGLVIDELFTGKTFYNKFADILGPKSIK